MKAHEPPPRHRGLAPLATLCVALLALLCSLILVVEGQGLMLWAGLDPVYAGQAASCVGTGHALERCGEELAAWSGGRAVG